MDDNIFHYLHHNANICQSVKEAIGLHDCDPELMRLQAAEGPPVKRFCPSDSPTIDLVVAFGGDGLVMHTNALFVEGGVPPTMCFDFGSLGFLAPFNHNEFRIEVRVEARLETIQTYCTYLLHAPIRVHGF